MDTKQKTIRDLSVDEREEIFVGIADTLDETAREALVEGNKQFATLSSDMAEAIRVDADELAREDIDLAERVLQEAAAMIAQFNAAHPYRMVSTAVH